MSTVRSKAAPPKKPSGKTRKKKQQKHQSSDDESSSSEDEAQKLWEMDVAFELPRHDEELPEFDILDSHLNLYRGHTDSIRDLAYDPSSGLLYSASWDQTVLVWNARDAQPLAVLPHGAWVNAVGICPAPVNGVVTCAEDGVLSLWQFVPDTVEFKVAFQLSLGSAPLTCLTVHDDNNFVFVGALNRASAVAMTTGSAAREYNCKSDVNVLRSQDEILYCGCDDGKIICFDIQGAFVLRELLGHSGPVRCLLMTDFLIMYSGGDDRTIKAWTLSTGVCNKTFMNHKKAVRALAIHSSDRDRFLYSAAYDGTIRCTKVVNGKSKVMHGMLVNCLHVVPDVIGKSKGHLLCGDYSGRIIRYPVTGIEASFEAKVV